MSYRRLRACLNLQICLFYFVFFSTHNWYWWISDLIKETRLFVQEGRCELVKKEKFTDSGACEIGVFYLMRRLPTHLPEYLDKPVSKYVYIYFFTYTSFDIS